MKTPARQLSLVVYLSSCVGLGLCSPPASAGEPEATDAEQPEAASEGVLEASAAPVAPDPGSPDPASLPWKLRPGIVAQTQTRGRQDFPWIQRWAPERLMIEVGLFGGMFFPAQNHDFYNPDSGHKPLWIVNGEGGLRLALFPERYIGVEVEGAAIPARVRTSTDDLAPLWAVRGHVIAQLPWWSVTPFVLIGAGAMGVSSHPVILGKDVDPSVHWGGGVKIYLHRYVGLRFEGRHVLAAKQATQRSYTSHGEFLAGFVFTLNRAKPLAAPPPDPDRDGDGFPNERDSCPDVPGVSPDGCPPRDTDKDGFVDTEDACPYEPGVEPDGCPIRDRDGDGIPDELDKCPDQPETFNGFEDEDGCPDEIPEEVREFSGIIQGIEFELDSAAIREPSKAILDRAIKVLEEYSDIRIEIVGHTDNQGTAEHNLQLSKDRAEAVKKYLVDGGIDESRLTTRGAGMSEPVASNDSEEGRAKNRRTEFKIVKTRRAP
ncbi:MAG: OmpA family protein [Enhygromyxa sp.]